MLFLKATGRGEFMKDKLQEEFKDIT